MHLAKQKIALITGAGSGIGAAIAKKLASLVDILILLDLDEQHLHSVKQKLLIQSSLPILCYQCDVGNTIKVKEVIEEIKREHGVHPNILINNAGFGGPFHPLNEVSDEEWEHVMFTNLKSVFNFARLLLPLMKEQSYGKIINIASIQGYLGAAFSSTYVASKHGVIGYTKAIAAEWGAYGINCNAVCPGYVNTQMGVQNEALAEHFQKVINKTPMGRIAEPDEIAALVAYLIGDEAVFINGSALTIDGGLTCHVGVS